MNLEWLKALFVSRKFWLAFLGVLTAAVMFAGGDIGADQLVEAVVLLVTVLMGGIALEDAAQKFGGRE